MFDLHGSLVDKLVILTDLLGLLALDDAYLRQLAELMLVQLQVYFFAAGSLIDRGVLAELGLEKVALVRRLHSWLLLLRLYLVGVVRWINNSNFSSGDVAGMFLLGDGNGFG